MPDPASVSDILAVLHLGDASGEIELAAELRTRFGVAENADGPAAQSHLREESTSDSRDFFLDRLPRWLPEVTKRPRPEDECPYTNPGIAEYLRQGLADLEGCFQETTTQQLRRFFDLPYWKARWQVFEIWVLRMVLASCGTHRWSPRLDGNVWDIKAGSTNRSAVATADLYNGRELRCYYQHESSPPASLVLGTRSRPEVLVTTAQNAGSGAAPGAEHEPVLLAVEAKARFGYRLPEMKSAVYPLMEWRPARILGASYFSVTGADKLHTQSLNGTEVALAETLTPGSSSALATNDWLRSMWSDLIGQRVTILAVDISASMPVKAAEDRLHEMTESLEADPGPDWLASVVDTDLLFLTTFGNSQPGLTPLDEFSPAAIAESGVDLDPIAGAQNLTAAVADWQAALDRAAPTQQRVDLHLITDGCWDDADLVALDHCRANGIRVHIHRVSN